MSLIQNTVTEIMNFLYGIAGKICIHVEEMLNIICATFYN